MGNIEIHSTVLIPCRRPEVYAFCVDPLARAAVPGQEDQVPRFQDLVPDRSWTETLESRTETITCSYVVYPVADSTRMTVTAQYDPEGTRAYVFRGQGGRLPETGGGPAGCAQEGRWSAR